MGKHIFSRKACSCMYLTWHIRLTEFNYYILHIQTQTTWRQKVLSCINGLFMIYFLFFCHTVSRLVSQTYRDVCWSLGCSSCLPGDSAITIILLYSFYMDNGEKYFVMLKCQYIVDVITHDPNLYHLLVCLVLDCHIIGKLH